MTALQALLGFAGWTLVMVAVTFSYRGVKLLGGAAINSWPRGAASPNDNAFAKRVNDAHANCIENLAVFAVIVLVAQALGKAELIAPLAAIVFYARIGQSVVHMIGTSQPLVFVRATFWAVQLVLMFWMLWKISA